MAGKVPFFLTGANARILLNNKTMAYATDVSYRIAVKHASPRVLGRFEVEVHQPLAYDVTGTFTVIRYSRGLKDYYDGGTPSDVNNAGSGIGSMGSGSLGGTVGSALGLPSASGQFDGKANEAFNPSRFFQSKMFNIEIRQKVVGAAAEENNKFFKEPPAQGSGKVPNSGTTLGKVLKKTAQVLNSLIPTALTDEIPIVVIRDCRIEEMSFSLSKRSVAVHTFTFKARYVDDDTFIARKSGVGQELS